MKKFLNSGLLLLTIVSTLTANAQVPLYSSNPAASSVIFLDFDGHTVSGTSWNYAGPFVCAPTTLSTSQMTSVINSVAEDYYPFDVNVTTDSTKYWAAPIKSRMRVILTTTYSWYGNGAGGVAFVGSFKWGDNTPCFIFTSLLNNNVKYISEAAAHEAGHTLGLYHQSSYDANCVKLSDYNYGNGSGETSWAPIMGVGYYKNLTQWFKGPNSYGCTNIQDDLDVITKTNGFSYKADDMPATFRDAMNAPFVSNTVTVNGNIERNTDQDMIKLTQPSLGRLVLDAIPSNTSTGSISSNVDLKITLYNSAQNVVKVYNPISLLSVHIDTLLPAGTYYAKIEGDSNIYVSNYASLGAYSIQAAYLPNITLPLRRLELSGEMSGDRHKLNWLIDADEQVIDLKLEVSSDGRHFADVAAMTTSDRSYMYKPTATTNLLYRLNVTFDNGKQYYSNTIVLRNNHADPRPKLVSNVLTTNTIAVTSPGNYDYFIYDFNGKTIGKGQLKNGYNTINATGISTSGMYLIRFANASDLWVEKFVRQ